MEKNKNTSIFSKVISKINVKFIVAVMVILCLVSIGMTLFYFTPKTSISDLIGAITNFDPDELKHYVLMEIKVPRIIGAIIVGALVAVGGAVMQGITRNYLASPGVVGVDNGAALGLSIAMAITGGATSYISNILFSMIGATVSTVIIFSISSRIRGREAGLKLLLAGNAIGMLFSGIAQAINIWSEQGQNINIWNNSGLLGIKWIAIFILVIGVIGIVIAMAISHKITILGMGEETAVSLGENVGRTKLWGILSVVLISATTVCTVGNIGFVGLVIPNMVKMAVGEDYRKVIPLSAVFGAMLILISDVISRLVNMPAETPLGTITSIIGIPIFLYLINSKRSKGVGE